MRQNLNNLHTIRTQETLRQAQGVRIIGAEPEMISKNLRNTLLENCVQFCEQNRLIPAGRTIVIGLSGGPDSVFLLHLLCSIRAERNLTLVAAHLDHGWRERSHEDVAFCQKLADQHAVTFVHGHARDFCPPDANQLKKTGSLEALGRTARRTFFEHVVKDQTADCVALGHHADDQLETFFIRLMRGTGVTGLAGIMPRNGIYVHPLLFAKKAEILAFLAENQIAYLIDQTNTDRRFLRNRIRHDVIPTLSKTDARFTESAARTITLLQKTQDYLTHETEKNLREIGNVRDGKFWVNSTKLLTLHPFLRDQVILAWLIQSRVPFTPSQDLIQEIVRFLGNSKSSCHTLYDSWRITKKQCYACIEV